MNKEELEQLRGKSAYTIVGVGDIDEYKKGYEELMKREGIGKPISWHTFTGKLMNDSYNLTGDNRYPNDLVFLCFPLDGLNVGKLAMFKLRMEDRWLDDVIDNDLRRKGK